MLFLDEDTHGAAGDIQGGMTIDIQSSSSFNVNGKILNGWVFASSYSIVAKFGPKRWIGLTGSERDNQPNHERNTRYAGQFRPVHCLIPPDKFARMAFPVPLFGWRSGRRRLSAPLLDSHPSSIV